MRKIDFLGHIVLPIELRRLFDLGKEDLAELFVNENYIMLKRYQPDCVFCGDAADVINFKGKNVCPNCFAEMKETK